MFSDFWWISITPAYESQNLDWYNGDLIYLARKQTPKGWLSLASQSESESESELQEHLSASENCHKWSHKLDRIESIFQIQFITPSLWSSEN